ncbi:glycoside hydrolase, putative [Phytophthora infestans T30-4]|uniref:Glycoside hydrolase, putative n=1 Tax=Phytophthora infestans (strain T30-4) TaxID=403677 RepID=D0P215_PHYIT|nr:glycoside hydrolase, putative [Phytophthora infestans T30-4]EEY55161.1 glycoside hydrolase, putative [Phytophthora infestans T30-4]|eukprot:XP_002895660.1 glycoside hydrolase, putative [Phytophthora infestans T30-4]
MTDTCPRLPVPEKWDAHKISSQKGKIAVVTGANSGIGYETALELARNGAHVILAYRNEIRGREAESRLRETLASTPETGTVEFMKLDAKYKRLDLLINNAGVAGGDFTLSEDGYELLFATNHLGHFALTARLFALIKSSTPSRIVNVSSQVHRQPKVFDEDEIMLNDAEKYSPMQNYGVTKLYNIMFAKELNRRMKANGVEGVTAAACHPGLSVSGLTSKTASASSSWLWWLFYKVAVYFPSQSAQMGALSTLYAAVGDAVEGGDYFGPNYLGLYGHPIREAPSGLSDAKDAAAKLWAFSEKLAKLAFEVSK